MKRVIERAACAFFVVCVFGAGLLHAEPAKTIAARTIVSKRATAATKTQTALKTAPKKEPATKSRVAVVVAEESQIYAEPDLDAKVVTIAKRGMKIPVSKGMRGEYAKFFRTRVNGKIGWILTIDIRSVAEAKKVFTKARAEAYKPGPFAKESQDEDEQDTESKHSKHEPFTFTRSVSLVVGSTEYKESINGVDHATNLLNYGLKLTGPDVFLTGPLMDVNILLHYGAPSYYSELSSTKPSGFVMWWDANLLLPIMARENYLIGIGAGPLLVISNIQASQGTQDYGMWQFNLGADLELTAGVRWGDFCARLEGKYYFEKKSYRQVQLAIGTVF